MSTKPLMPIAGRIKFTEGEPYEDGSLGKKVKDLDDSVANETSDRQYADAVIQNQLNEETLHLVPNYISNANTFLTAGAGKTNTSTTGLPPEVSAYEHDKWGTIFYLPENEEERTGTQIYHCIAYASSPNRGKIYKRLIISGIPTAWELVGGGGSKTTIVETIEDAPENPQVGDRITVLQDGSTDSVPMSAVIGLINALNGKQNLLPGGANNGDILLWDSSQNKYVSKPKWQMIYQPVEYIESTGTQYINTAIVADGIDIRFKHTNLDNNCIFGSDNNDYSSTTWKRFGENLYNDYFQIMYGNGDTSFANIIPEDTNWHTVQSGKKFSTIIFDNIDRELDLTSANAGAVDMFLFALNNGREAAQKVMGSISHCKLYQGTVLVRDFQPVYNIFTGEIGLFDKVNNKFYGNAGTGTFLKGADV